MAGYTSYDAAKKAADRAGGSVGWTSDLGWHIVGGSSGVSTGGSSPYTYDVGTTKAPSYWTGSTPGGYGTQKVEPLSTDWLNQAPSYQYQGATGPYTYFGTGQPMTGGLEDIMGQLNPKSPLYNGTRYPVQGTQGLQDTEVSELASLLGGGAGLGTPVQSIESMNGYDVIVSRDANGNIVDMQVIGATQGQGAGGMDAWQQAQMGMQTEQLAWEKEYAGMQQAWQEQQLAWQQEQARMNQEIQQANLDLSQKQIAAQLAAQPASWLEYASFMGETPKVQAWMLPLMSQEYSQLKIGDEIPGWTAEDMTGMPELTTASQQYLARMGPSALQQYYAYLWALSGQNPEESEFRFESLAPPSGQYGGLYRNK